MHQNKNLLLKEIKELRESAIGGAEILGIAYYSQLPEELLPWYCYLPNSGHSVLAIIDQYVEPNMSFDILSGLITPLPVKTVLKGYNIQKGFPIVTGIINTICFGTNIPENDYEFEDHN